MRTLRAGPLAALLLAVGLLLQLAGCTAHAADLPVVMVPIKDQSFALEIARTPDQRERGLMYRDSMPADHGMIFIFDRADRYPFWMHNTRIPLDIIYLSAAGQVVDIHTRRAYDETSLAPKAPALYVIELNAGVADKLKLHIGDSIALPANALKQPDGGVEK